MKKTITALVAIVLLATCQSPSSTESDSQGSLPSITGNPDYLASPFVTAGDRLYVVGHQDGTFPDHGWHVQGEMGGIWAHPIKLMDGFVAAIDADEDLWVLNDASSFISSPVDNRHIFESEERQLVVERRQFVPDQMEGLMVEFSIRNNSSSAQTIDFNFTAMVDLMPVWLAEELALEDGPDQIQVEESYLWAKDNVNDWFTAWTVDGALDNTTVGKPSYSPERKGLGEDATITSSITVPANDRTFIRYFIAGSDQSLEEAVRTMEAIKSSHITLMADKIARYEAINASSKLDIPDKKLADMYEWTKYNTDWLMRDVDGVGRGLSAGMADYPWWFGADNCYSLQGLLATGQHEEVFSTIDLIFKLSKDANGDNGRIMHEASTNGVVFNPGNLNETPHFIYLLWKVFEWTGDEAFLREYFDEAQAGLEWIMEQDHDGNGYADGPGMMEIPGLHTEMIDVFVYTQQAAWALGQMAGALGMSDEAAEYDSIASALRSKINSEWWSEDAGSYADFRATRGKTLELIDAAIVRSDTIDKPWAVEELKESKVAVAASPSGVVDSRVIYHNWVVNTPMEMGIADSAKAQEALEEGRKYRSKYGVYVTGLDRDESQSESSKWEVFSYVGAVMTLPTGVQAMAEANYGNIEESYEYMKQLTNSFSHALPGSTYEVSPDYGMMAQAWNIYAVAVPIVTKYFGIQPQAHLKQITLRPNMPADWDNASISDVKIGDNQITLTKSTDGNKVTFVIEQTKDWDILFYPPASGALQMDAATIYLNESGYVKLSGSSNTIDLTL